MKIVILKIHEKDMENFKSAAFFENIEIGDYLKLAMHRDAMQVLKNTPPVRSVLFKKSFK